MARVKKLLFERTLKALGWEQLTRRLADLAVTSLCRELCLNLPLNTDPEIINRELKQTSELKSLLEEETDIPLEEFQDIQPALLRSAKEGILEGKDLMAIAQTLKVANEIRKFFQHRSKSCPLLYQISSPLVTLPPLERNISKCFDPNGEILDSASPTLKRLRRKATTLRNRITKKLNTIINSPANAKILQDRYYTIRSERYVIPLRAEARTKIKGIVHDSSASGATVFVEPLELVELNNQLKRTELEVNREIREILKKLTLQVKDNTEALQSNLKILTAIDLTLAKSLMSRLLNASEPTVNTKGRIHLYQSRHPLLVLRGVEVIANDIALGDEFLSLIITGPNTGGKTVNLMTLGLCSLMVRAGLHIPAAPASEMAIFKDIYADIGDEQSLEQDLSSFSSHLVKIVDILKAVSSSSLVLLDEIVSSTDPSEGTALARAVLERLIDRKVRTVSTTHYSGLKELAANDHRFRNASVEFDLKTLSPTYRLLTGLPGRSSAIDIAHRLGLEPGIINRARELWGREDKSLDALLAEIDQERQKLERDQKEILQIKAETKELKEQYQERLAKTEDEQRKLADKIQNEVSREISSAKKEIARIIKGLQRQKTLPQAQDAREKMMEVEKKVASEINKYGGHQKPPAGEIADISALKAGEKVKVISLGKEGKVLEKPRGKEKVKVQVGGITMIVDSSVLKPIAPGEASAEHKLSIPNDQIPMTKSQILMANDQYSSGDLIPLSCDLRGKRVDEALNEVIDFLDQATLANHQRISIIHGHGTGALKSAVRDYLKDSPYVRRFRAGELSEGGDGVTVVELG
ncbi:MAG: endonuclease MutS2 [Deltaproteobacteria bacterium]|nr:MAG: endonuclease MutS2 [Deltaproteobacteria bacterium]